MIGEVIVCENEGCEESFAKKTHNQRYHDSNCTRLATNAHLMDLYRDNRARVLGKPRYCEYCDRLLSRYNVLLVCSACQAKAESTRNNAVADMLSNIASVI